MSYIPETTFDTTDDFGMVYNLRWGGRYAKGYPVMENDVAISISVSQVSKENLQEIAKSIKDALNAKFNTPTIQEQ